MSLGPPQQLEEVGGSVLERKVWSVADPPGSGPSYQQTPWAGKVGDKGLTSSNFEIGLEDAQRAGLWVGGINQGLL